MNWESLDAFLAMGGYGLYVWGSFAVTFALIALEVLQVAVRRRAITGELGRTARAPRSMS